MGLISTTYFYLIVIQNLEQNTYFRSKIASKIEKIKKENDRVSL